MTTTQSAAVIVTNDPAAHAALRAAHDGGYRFPAGFNGFAADIGVTVQTEETVSHFAGSTMVGGPRATTIELDAPDDVQGWVRQELASMAGHRWPTPYEQSDGRWTLTIEGNEAGVVPLGNLVTVHDDPFGSSYRLREGRISQVTRVMGPMRFTITIQQHVTTPDGRTLPAAFTVNYWKLGEGRLTRSDSYTDAYTEVDAVQVPASRRVITATDAGFEARELTVTNVRLLTEPVASTAPDQVAGADDTRHGTRAG